MFGVPVSVVSSVTKKREMSERSGVRTRVSRETESVSVCGDDACLAAGVVLHRRARACVELPVRARVRVPAMHVVRSRRFDSRFFRSDGRALGLESRARRLARCGAACVSVVRLAGAGCRLGPACGLPRSAERGFRPAENAGTECRIESRYGRFANMGVCGFPSGSRMRNPESGREVGTEARCTEPNESTNQRTSPAGSAKPNGRNGRNEIERRVGIYLVYPAGGDGPGVALAPRVSCPDRGSVRSPRAADGGRSNVRGLTPTRPAPNAPRHTRRGRRFAPPWRLRWRSLRSAPSSACAPCTWSRRRLRAPACAWRPS